MKTLSIDWDYFFPDSTPYDWGANEEQAIFYEIAWLGRCYNKNIFTRKEVLDEYHPSIPTNFWSIVKNKPKVFVADSHSQIWKILKGQSVVSLDAHHDMGYREDESFDLVNCGNWASQGMMFGKIKEFSLHYPLWRKQTPESNDKPPCPISFSLPKPQEYDSIFICRSGCWTPPWCDPAFKKFVTSFSKDYQTLDSMVWKHRQPDLAEAKENRNQMKKLMDKMFAKKEEVTV